MGLSPEGSYIIVISGEEDTETSPSSNARVVDPPHYDIGEDVGSSDYFSYTLDGTTYDMRYVTVSGATDNTLNVVSEYDLSYSPNIGDLFLDTVGIGVSYGIDTLLKLPVSSVGSFITSFYTNLLAEPYTIVDPNTYTMNATSNWTRGFIQVWNEEYEGWYSSQSSAYVVSAVWLSNYCYEQSTGAIIEVFSDRVYATKYSPLYSSSAQCKINAINAYLIRSHSYDFTGDVDFYYTSGETLVGNNNSGAPLFTHDELYRSYP